MNKTILLSIMIFICSLLFADNTPNKTAQTGPYKAKTTPELIDSLEKELSIAKEDTNKVNILTDIAFNKRNNKPDESIKLAEEALALSEKLNWKKGQSNSLRIIGNGNLSKSKYDIALSFFEQALKIGEELNDKQIIADLTGNIGIVFYSNSNFTKSLEYYEKALKIAEEIGDKSGIGKNLGNIGIVYQRLSNYPKALEYYEKALKIDEEIGIKKGIGRHLGNIGVVYQRLSNYPKALEYCEKALKIHEEIGDKSSIGACLVNIGTVYGSLSNYPKALEYFEKALKIAEEIGDKASIGNKLGNIGVVYSSLTNYPKALEYFEKALKIAENIGNKSSIGINLSNIGEIYVHLSKYPKALEYQEKSLKISEEIGDLSGQYFAKQTYGGTFLAIAQDTNKVASDSSKKDNLKLALSFTQTALAGFTEIKEEGYQKECEEQLSDIYEAMGDYKSALVSYKKAQVINDSIFSLDTKTKIANLENIREIEQKNSELALKAKENDLLKQKSENQALELIKRNQELTLLNTKQALQKAELDKRNAEIEKRNGEVKLLQKDKDLANLSIKANEAEAKNKANEIKILQANKKEQEIEIKTKSYQLYISILGIFSVLLVAFIIYRERKKSEELLLNVLPAVIATRLKQKEHPIADSFDEASIVFIDIVGFTKSSATQDPKRVAEVLNIIYTKLDHIAKKYNLEKIKTIGDCYMAASGLPIADPKNAEKAANFAKEAMQMLYNYDTGDGTIIRFRCGLDCGPVVAGVIGEHKFIYDVWGDTVNMAARMEQNGEPDKIHTTERFKNKITSNKGLQPLVKFESRGEMEIKGKGLVTTYFMG